MCREGPFCPASAPMDGLPRILLDRARHLPAFRRARKWQPSPLAIRRPHLACPQRQPPSMAPVWLDQSRGSQQSGQRIVSAGAAISSESLGSNNACALFSRRGIHSFALTCWSASSIGARMYTQDAGHAPSPARLQRIRTKCQTGWAPTSHFYSLEHLQACDRDAVGSWCSPSPSNIG